MADQLSLAYLFVSLFCFTLTDSMLFSVCLTTYSFRASVCCIPSIAFWNVNSECICKFSNNLALRASMTITLLSIRPLKLQTYIFLLHTLCRSLINNSAGSSYCCFLLKNIARSYTIFLYRAAHSC